MSANEERRKILEMVANGKINASEAAELLGNLPAAPPEAAGDRAARDTEAEMKGLKAEEAPEPGSPEPKAEAGKPQVERERPTRMHVRVSDLKSGKHKVSVNIPLRLVKIGMRIGRGFAPELGDLDWDELSASLAEGEGGIIVDVQDEEDGEHVQVFVD